MAATNTRKILQLIPASKGARAVYSKIDQEVIDSYPDDASYVYADNAEVYLPVEMWALVEHEDGSRSVLGMSADDIHTGNFCSDTANFDRYVTLTKN